MDNPAEQYKMNDEIADTSFGAPHVVILGSGASRAAFPSGDMHGHKLPVMDELIATVGLEELLEKNNIEHKEKNFEAIFSDLYAADPNQSLLKTIESRTREYFQKLRIPEAPTVYDYLVLSLRKKDLIATFNWDPLLFYTMWRNHKKADMPQVVYLHGNIGIGYCADCRMKGAVRGTCIKCKNPYTDSEILFPVKEKNYSTNPLISSEWDTLRKYLSNAYWQGPQIFDSISGEFF